jgi:hypothetical protein
VSLQADIHVLFRAVPGAGRREQAATEAALAGAGLQANQLAPGTTSKSSCFDVVERGARVPAISP